MIEPYPAAVVPAEVLREDETLGTKPKFWFVDATGALCLFKRGRPNEDWSEKVAAEVARAVGVPAARVELAECDGERGTVSASFLDAGDQMYHGNELLLTRDPTYPSGGTYRVQQHTVGAVFDTLAWYATGAPDGALPPTFDGCDVMVGYLALDALVGNTDRHHENWAVVRRGRRAFLAPSYDHAASLGRNEPPRRMRARLEGTDPRLTVEGYVAKGRSGLYANDRVLTLLDAFRAAAMIRPTAAGYWRDRLRQTPPEALVNAVARVPSDRICETNRRFAQAILLCNYERLLAEDDGD